MSNREYDAIARRAEKLRPHLPAPSVVGLAVPSGFDVGALGLTRPEDASRPPFAGWGVLGSRTVVVMPEAATLILPERIEAIRVLRALGGTTLIVAEPCTALRPHIDAGALVGVADHINMTGVNPLVGRNEEAIGPRFPDMTEPYDAALLEAVEQAALEERVRLQRYVYAAVSHNPTPAECRFLACVGADVFGFGLVPDTVIARHAGLRVLAVGMVQRSRMPDGPNARAVGADRKIAPILRRVIRSENL